MNLILYTSLDNAFSQQEEKRREEEKDNFGSSRLSEESNFQHLIFFPIGTHKLTR